jgi:hypothetical protein
MTVPTRLPRPMTPPGPAPAENHRTPSKLSFGVVCSSNINRSMEAHVVVGNAGNVIQVATYNNVMKMIMILFRHGEIQPNTKLETSSICIMINCVVVK